MSMRVGCGGCGGSCDGGDADTLEGYTADALIELGHLSVANPSVPRTVNPGYSNLAGVTSPTVNTITFLRVEGVGTIDAIGLTVGTSNGTLCVAVCTGPEGRAHPTTRVATSGSVPFPASGYAEIALDVAVAVDGNSWFALQKGSGTGTVRRHASMGTAYDIFLGFAGSHTGAAYPIPNPVAPDGVQPEAMFVMIGVPT